jgi:glyoxylase-like metal-dependent hydrolase (beta-lactamase superfamily II)
MLTFQLSPVVTNCYVLKEGGEAIIIDPGDPAEELLASVADAKVTMVFNTHCHFDHSAGNAGVMEATGAPLVCHQEAVPMLQRMDAQGQMFGVPITPSPDPDRLIEEGDTITVGATSFEVLYTPGHAPGHVVLVGDGVVFGGDVLFAGSIGRTDLPGGDHELLLESIKTKLLPLPDETVVYSGHGPPTTIGQERATNPFLIGL